MSGKRSKKTIAIQPESGGLGVTAAKLAHIREELRDEYQKSHRAPWIIAYSGGKDSTLLLQMVFDLLLSLPEEERKRMVHVVGNDTLVESPLVNMHLHESINQIRRAAARLELPLHTMVTIPDTDQTFWVNVIGRGYPPPSRIFRWCTDRMKIQPTSNYITRRINERGKAILLIGARKSESANRRRAMEKRYRKGKRLSKHPTHDKCMVFSPLAELDTDELWTILLQTRPPWGGSHRKLVTLYRNARGSGECPLVLSKDDAPSCGTTSPRFGCWTCTVVPKDRSLSGLVDSGFEEFEPLLDFRDWLVEIRDIPDRRMKTRRDGTVRYLPSGKVMMGPFTLETRREIYDKLKSLQQETGKRLISLDEEDWIKHIWQEDEVLDEVRSRRYLSKGEEHGRAA